jgi:hypothetical protein
MKVVRTAMKMAESTAESRAHWTVDRRVETKA